MAVRSCCDPGTRFERDATNCTRPRRSSLEKRVIEEGEEADNNMDRIRSEIYSWDDMVCFEY